MDEKTIKGFKFLDPTGATYPDRRDGTGEMRYILPRPDQKWGDWMDHPDPAEPDGKACGSGRYHIHLCFTAEYAPANWWPWFVEAKGIIGEDGRKAGVMRLRLRRIAPKVLHRALRPPFNWGRRANLRDANLSYADLRGANLSGADLSGADLHNANLRGADLHGADLYRANLSGADLYRANLSGADLYNANLSYADLRGANLSGADLSGADLHNANLYNANLYGARWNKYTIWPAGFEIKEEQDE